MGSTALLCRASGDPHRSAEHGNPTRFIVTWKNTFHIMCLYNQSVVEH